MPPSRAPNPLRPFLEHQGLLILDGGLATELEARGADLGDELWSARLLLDDPELLRQVHLDYLAAGADCITSASYQATLQGFAERRLSDGEAVALIERSVALATAARDAFWSDPAHRRGRLRPLVAASVGPYGAYLADGSEYRGDYGLDEAALARFHRRRLRILSAAGADLLACETLPSYPEARALRSLLAAEPGPPAWLSFSCRDGHRLHDGTPLARVLAELDGAERVVAVGINCTAPHLLPELLAAARRATSLPIVVYPNSGEAWDAAGKRWLELASPPELGEAARGWHEAGAVLLGGCCRIGPGQIRGMRQRLLRSR